MITNWVELGDSIAPDYLFQGSAHLYSDYRPEEDVVQELRDVVEEVTQRPIPKTKNKIGFY